MVIVLLCDCCLFGTRGNYVSVMMRVESSVENEISSMIQKRERKSRYRLANIKVLKKNETYSW